MVGAAIYIDPEGYLLTKSEHSNGTSTIETEATLLTVSTDMVTTTQEIGSNTTGEKIQIHSVTVGEVTKQSDEGTSHQDQTEGNDGHDKRGEGRKDGGSTWSSSVTSDDWTISSTSQDTTKGK